MGWGHPAALSGALSSPNPPPPRPPGASGDGPEVQEHAHASGNETRPDGL